MRHNKQYNRKHVVSAIAVAGILSLGATPVWAQQKDQQSQPQRSNAGAEDGMITASALEGSRVLDKRNREIGTISNLFIDPKTGKIVRAGIEFDKKTFGGEKYSVTWDELSIKRQDGKTVIAVDESVLDRVQSAAKQDGSKGREGRSARQQQRESQKDQQANRRSGVPGLGGTDSKKDQQQVSASQLSSDQIRKIQQELNKKGFAAGQVNGQWSSETQSAVKNFQQSKGLSATGELDQRTIEELGLDADDFRQKSKTGSDSGSSGNAKGW
ncbi:MAG: hypothetical protein GEU77_13745 [Deltaproteobacteria bacterium]|nr:hypothetical protein [Deltaproteobacteria bacterium]